MEQLKNIDYAFDIDVGDAGVTVRKGSKWFDYSTGSRFEMRVCPKGHDGTCNSLCNQTGIGRKIGAWKGPLMDLPANLLSIEHNKKARNMETLREMLEMGYGSIDPHDVVTAMIYIRES